MVKDENLKTLCTEYNKKDMADFLNYVSLNMRLDLVTAREDDSEDVDSQSDIDYESDTE